MNRNIPEIRNPLVHSGTSRFERLAAEMQFDYIQIEERHEQDFLHLSERLANQFLFFDATNRPNGTWRSFFSSEVPSNRPHKALFIAFLRLLEALNQHANGLTKRHLDFYYEEVLQFTQRASQPNEAHVFFQCAKALKEKFIAEKETLLAGENKDGKKILYALVDEIVVNRAQVTRFVSRYQHSADYGNRVMTNKINEEISDPESFPEGIPLFGHHELKSDTNDTLVFNNDEEQKQEHETLGFAISSELLRLKEGERTISLRLLVDNTRTISYQNNDLKVRFTAEDGWWEKELTTAEVTVDSTEVILKVVLENTDPSVVGYDAEVHEGTYSVTHPIAQVIINPLQDTYGKWKSVRVREAKLQVEVKGVRSLNLQNEQSALDASKPFRPFGAIPSDGDHFYIGHSSIFNHALERAELKIDWKDIDYEQFGDLYASYAYPVTNASFKVNASFLRENVWKPSIVLNLFDLDNAKSRANLVIENPSIERVEDERVETPWNYNTRQGYLRLTLNSDPDFSGFGHKVYPKEVMRVNAENQTSPTPVTLNQPYTPHIESLTLDYTTEEVSFSQFDSDQFFQITSLGQKKISLGTSLEDPFLLPHFEHEGVCYVGVNQLVTPQSLNLLFRFVEGTGVAEESQLTSGIRWSYLSGDEWITINPLRISKDTSRNLLNTGIIRFDCPKDMDTVHEVMPNGLHWLRAQMPTRTAGLDFLQGIYAQAVEIKEQDSDDQDGILPPNTATKLTNGGKGIAKIHQPFASYNGTTPDTEEVYYARTTERLRHKDRGVMIWDYERLVLDQFNDLFKVKCLSHTNYQTEMMPGHVMIAVIPNLRNRGIQLPFQPKLSLRKRLDIYDFLRDRISPFIHLRIENPIYEPIRLSFNVGFHHGLDEGFYGKKLHQQIQEFLSPWAFKSELKEDASLVFGGELHKSTLLKFIEDLEYVDFVNDFNMYHIYQNPSIGELFDSKGIQGRFPDTSSFSEHEKNGAADKIWIKFEENTFITLELRFLKGLIDLSEDQLIEKFTKKLYSALKKNAAKGKQIDKTLVQIIIKNMYYVDRLIHINVYKKLLDDYIMEDTDVAVAKSGRSIMVTSEQHQIGVYRAGDYQCEGNVVIGIGVMIIEADFYVTPEKEKTYEYIKTR